MKSNVNTSYPRASKENIGKRLVSSRTSVQKDHVAEPVLKPTKSMKQNAGTYYLENKKANTAYSKANKARKALFSEMKDAGIERFTLNLLAEKPDSQLLERLVKTVVSIETPELQKMDCRKLWDILDASNDPKGFEKFMETISASKTDVERVHGKDMAVRLAKPVLGTENVTVKEVEG